MKNIHTHWGGLETIGRELGREVGLGLETRVLSPRSSHLLNEVMESVRNFQNVSLFGDSNEH